MLMDFIRTMDLRPQVKNRALTYTADFYHSGQNWLAGKLSKLRREQTKLLCFMLSKPWPCISFCFTSEPNVFYWLVVHLHFNTFCALCTVKANEQKGQRTKTYNKEAGKFINNFALSTMFSSILSLIWTLTVPYSFDFPFSNCLLL